MKRVTTIENQLIASYGDLREKVRHLENGTEGERSAAAELLTFAKELEGAIGRLASIHNRHLSVLD